MQEYSQKRDYTNAEILNVIDEMIYISDMDTHDILFANDATKNTSGCHNLSSKKCYEVFHHRSSPCENCENVTNKTDILHNWETSGVFLEDNGRYYQYKNKKIFFGGRRARLEIAFDITEQVEKNDELSAALNIEKFVTEQVAKLSSTENLPETLNEVLKAIGIYMNAERVYIFENRGDVYTNTFEWCADKIVPQIDNLQKVDNKDVRHWTRILEKSECIFVEDIEDIAKTSPEEYSLLKMQDIKSCIEAPIMRGDKLVGFIGVDNAPVDMNTKALYLLKTMGYFISIIMQNVENKSMLESLSYMDYMTGTANRNAYNKQLENVKNNYKGQPCGFALCDLNGLKQINDKYGHQAGDDIIQKFAEILTKVFGKGLVFRIGGDEFAVIMPGLSESFFVEHTKRLTAELSENDDIKVAVGTVWCEECYEPEYMMKKADEHMYCDKKKYYENIGTTK